MTPTPKTCATCIHHFQSECRRFPPQVSVIMVPQRNVLAAQTQIQPTPVACFPQVTPDLSCGEWSSGEPLFVGVTQ